MLRKGGRTEKRLKKFARHFHSPAFADNFGIRLPLKHSAITAAIHRDIYFGDYERKEKEIISSRLEKNDIVMEVGAGIGFLAAFCAKRIGSERVFAYEANPALMEIIHQIHADNGVSPTVRNVLLGDGDGEREFFLEKDFWASSLIPQTKDAKSIRVPQEDLNAEIRRIAPTFMIVDIEGGEEEFFRIAKLDPVRKLCIEFHPHTLGNHRISAIIAHLIGQGFALDFGCMRKNVLFFSREA
jgi:FkbM family methyltransferase